MGREQIPGRDAYLHIYDRFLRGPIRQNAIVVEIGVALGKSISYVAEELIKMGRTDVAVYAVDPWAGTARNGEQQETLGPNPTGDFALYCDMMRTHSPLAFDFVRVLRCTGVQAADLFDKVDCLVLDGDHDYETVLSELELWSGIVRQRKNGGILGGDDYHAADFPGVIRAVNEVVGVDNIEIHHDQDWPTWVRK